MRPVYAIDDLLSESRLGELVPGATRADVSRVLGLPVTWSNAMPVERATIWLYGKPCRGHVELHFTDDDALWMVFSDYLPIRRIRTPCFELDPGCLGGITPPTADRVHAMLTTRAVAYTTRLRDPRWADPPPPPDVPRVPIARWNAMLRREGRGAVTDSALHAETTTRSGAVLGLGYEKATLSSGEVRISEDVVMVVSVGFERDASEGRFDGSRT